MTNSFPSPAAFERSTHRSRLRWRALMMLSSLGEAFPRQLASSVGIDCSRLRAVMHGRPPAYSEDFALVPLGLARLEVTPQGRVYSITSAGRRKVRQMMGRQARRDEVRAMRRTARAGGQVQPHLTPNADERAATPVGRLAPSCISFHWSVEG